MFLERSPGSRGTPHVRPTAAAAAAAAVLLVALASGGGCSSARAKKDVTTIAGSHHALTAQATPSEIQAAVMAFADKFISRAAGVFDQVHDEARSPEERVFARQAKLSVGLGALTIACEVNPVASLFDMVALTRLQGKSFADHWAPTLRPEHASAVGAMYARSERDAWQLARSFITEGQADQLRELIDDWYRRNPDMRYTSHVRLAEFASFRREAAPHDSHTPASVLALLRIDPLSGMDPVARGLQESRLLAERTIYFAARLSPLATWQAQRFTADLLAVPEFRGVLEAAGQLETTVDRLPEEIDGIVSRATGDVQKLIAAEREAAIRQTDAAVTSQREALMRDLDGREQGLRNLLADVDRSIATAAGDVSASANRTVAAAEASSTAVVDHAFRRALALLLIVLLGVPVATLAYRYAASHLPDDRRHRRSEVHEHEPVDEHEHGHKLL